MKIIGDKLLLFSVPALFIFVLLINALWIANTGILTSDFNGVRSPIDSSLVLSLAVIIALPYLLIYFFVGQIETMRSGISDITSELFYFVCGLAIIAIFLTIFFNVGKMAAGIYQISPFLKPLFVLINRFDPTYMALIFILSPFTKLRGVLVLTILILILHMLRATLMIAPIIFILLFFRIILSGRDQLKPRAFNALFFCVLVFGILLFVAAPFLFELRDLLRNTPNNFDFTPRFYFAQLLGRFSNLSAAIMFIYEYEGFKIHFGGYPPLAFSLDSLKYFWGGFGIKIPNHYEYFTGYFDKEAVGVYAMLTGLLPVILLDLMWSPFVVLFDVIVILFFAFSLTKLTMFFLGERGKLVSITLLCFAILSGAPGEFTTPIFSLFLYWIVSQLFMKLKTYREPKCSL